MENTTIETLTENKHQITLSDLGFIQLNEIVGGIEQFGGTDIIKLQSELNRIIQLATKSRPENNLDNLKTMSSINEIFTFIAMYHEHAGTLREKMDPVNETL